jgi:1-acyl-sn-glycerol-3-phosphate acyltransferase
MCGHVELSVPPSDSVTEEHFRFVAAGGIVEKVRARLAGPLLVSASHLIGRVAANDRLRVVHSLERVMGRMAAAVAAVRFDISGLESVDPSERYVIVPLHEGFADALALLRLPLGLRFAARDELFGWPGLGAYLAATRHPRVDTSPSMASLRRLYDDVGRVFDEGDSLVVFAQGSILGVEVAFQSGPLRLARHFGRPLLPVVLTGSHRVWEHPYSYAMRSGQRISMRVLDPIPADALDAAAFRDLERDMKKVALGDDVAPVRRFEPRRDGWWDGYHFEIDPDFPELRHRVAAHRGKGIPDPDRHER